MPFGNFANHADCVRQNPDKDDPDAYCGSIQARTENKLVKAVAAASHLSQSVRLALHAVAKHKDRQGSTEHHQRGGAKPKTTPHTHEQPITGHSYREGVKTPVRAKGEPLSHSHTEGRDRHGHAGGEYAQRWGKETYQKAHDPVKEEGDKKLKEADGVAADGAQDDQPFAVAFGPDNYDKLTKDIMAKTYSPVFKATRRIIHNITTERSFR